jgi:hypothetical protein
MSFSTTSAFVSVACFAGLFAMAVVDVTGTLHIIDPTG